MSESPEPAKTDARVPIMRDLAWPLRIITGALFVVIVTLTVAQVAFRYVLSQPLIWSEELAKLLLVWMVFLGAAVLCWDGRHLDVDVVFRLFPPIGRRILRGLNLALAAGFLVGLTLWSWDVVVLEGYSDLGALGISRGWLRLPATIGGGLMLFFMLLRRFAGGWRGAPDDGTSAL